MRRSLHGSYFCLVYALLNIHLAASRTLAPGKLVLNLRNKFFLTRGTALAAVAPRRAVKLWDGSVLAELGRAPGFDVEPPLDAGQ